MTGREYDDWFTAGDEQLIAGQLEMDRRHQAAQSRILITNYERVKDGDLNFKNCAEECEALESDLRWLADNAPIGIWSGHRGDGTPLFSVAKMDADGISILNQETPDGEGETLSAAIAAARKGGTL